MTVVTKEHEGNFLVYAVVVLSLAMSLYMILS